MSQRPTAPTPIHAPLAAALFDRDGVLNEDVGYLSQAHTAPDAWSPIPGSLAALARLSIQGIHVGVCTNQSGIGRELIGARDIAAIHRKLRLSVADLGGEIGSIRFCPHRPDDACACRKPLPDMLRDTLRDARCATNAACFIGDSLRDMQAALALGVEPVLVRTGNGRRDEAAARRCGVTKVFEDCAHAVDHLLETMR